jgi:mannose-6-phosphate isomerase-like protein (cupin superfamily)
MLVADRLRTACVDEGRPMSEPVQVETFRLDDMATSPTAALFEGGPRAGVGISVFVVRTRPGGAVELHVHPYPETFLLVEGRGRWTAGDVVADLEPNGMIVVPPETPHGFRNIGETPLLVVSVHEAPAVEQTFLGRDPA